MQPITLPSGVQMQIAEITGQPAANKAPEHLAVHIEAIWARRNVALENEIEELDYAIFKLITE